LSTLINSQVRTEEETRQGSPLRTVFHGSVWFGLAIGLNRILPGFLIIVLAWWLNPTQLGEISFVLAYYALLLPIADWSISYALQKLIPEHKCPGKQIYWTALLTRFGISTLLGLLCCGLDLTTRAFHGYGICLALLLIASSFGTVVYAHNAMRDFLKGSVYSIGLHIVWVGLALVLVKMGMPVVGPLLALSMSFALLGLCSCFFDRSFRGDFVFLTEVANEIIRFGLWATVAVVLSGFAGQIGILIIDYMRGDGAAGVFKVATTFGVISALLGIVVVLPLMPVAREGMLRGNNIAAELVRPIIRYLLMLGLPITAAGFVLAPEIIGTFTTQAYAAAVWPLRILLGANLLRMLMTAASGILFVGEGLRTLTKIYGVMVAVTLTVGVILVRRWGINGMAAAQLISWIGGAILMCRWFWRKTPVHIEWRVYLRYALSAVTMAAIVYLGKQLVHAPFERLIFGICASGIVYLLMLWLQRDAIMLRAVRALRTWAFE
jgi:O-antigen/teichoic acid export membrane protein